MNQGRSQFRNELAIIPKVAIWIAVAAFLVIEVCLLCILPRHHADLPPMPWWTLIAIVGGVFVAIIIALIGYVNADSRRRGMNPLLWTLLVIFVPKALGFIAYFLLRKPLLVPCPKCGTTVAADFHFCQKCGYALSPTCTNCGRAISHDFACCPYCGKPVAAAAT